MSKIVCEKLFNILKVYKKNVFHYHHATVLVDHTALLL